MARQASTMTPAGLPPSLMRRMITSWILGVWIWILATLVLMALLTDVYSVLIPVRPMSTLPGDVFNTLVLSVMYAPLLFVPALVVGGIVGLIMGLWIKSRLSVGVAKNAPDIRTVLRSALLVIWFVLTACCVLLAFLDNQRSPISLSPPFWVLSVMLIVVTTLVLVWIERRFMRWYVRHASDNAPPQQVVQQT